ncbi:hypothetical protein [Mucilaginibacter glaciei]|uniref:Uncharacterized protein n=1 Tax=Mucilaginibacter glaciei TaxID=2772109 RepID=A0A926S4E8_9SPHI|nr:hypothetical protein [Mucilaginibacter glaciei]MBD1395184.1 hypothetical protein [Mucilaginibacter glaciei]
MAKQILVTGNPFMVTAFYGSLVEHFVAGETIIIRSVNGWWCKRSIRQVFAREHSQCLVDL